MTDNELQNLVEKISFDSFDRPFQHHATFNSHLRTTGGRYLLKTHDLEFNPKMVTLEDFNKIIKHELVHYHLHLSHQGYQHKDSDFKQLLVRVGGIRYAPDIGERQSSKCQWLYRCENGHDIIRKRRFQTERYRCGQCQARIKFIGKLSNK
ncbi:SprT family protein [Leuconostoc mesenteroides]|jgi:Uncharacterized protein conserved in bacteria|uniref:Metallopeptidase, SprT family n=1 Tax=Leuconostoc mesenteroides subsp. cremoris ATCC 19254 TaxID=586220 RepID=C2KL83_LEUMC|nr:SprT family protein [Leuconostoc mesenteroides]EQC84431.1 zinc-metalloprotease [Leuconostoc mesenteroides subsp. cremoris TIFN8]KDA52500.1 putative metallopeptidase (Zinc) SprT family [Leuconostoc mesenteroides subsp. cremoris T26]AET29941.1 protein SprT-like protein [Leuconostoc mesenteroides subsp. mesenteroides J18]AKP36538.1 protein SprT-like protein [Leuconostoc mesenteroides subsp. dextranicum]AQU48936.1 SprT family protein [Leuconostoc mesenteroides subsp. mesenteroides]